MRDKINTLLQKFWNNKKLLKFLIFLTISVFFFVLASKYENIFAGVTLILALTMLSVLFLITWLMATFAVFRSLLIVGAGLSLLLFISIEYCRVPIEMRIADEALINLINLGIIFLGFVFITSLFKELFGNQKSDNPLDQKGALQIFKEINQGRHSWLLLSLYAISLGIILGQLFQVLYPIFNNLCIYQP
jgi:hypothetical protein